MSFTFTVRFYNKVVNVTFDNLRDETIDDLRSFTTTYYNLQDISYKFLDLGRIMDENEKLIAQPRNSFTLYIK